MKFRKTEDLVFVKEVMDLLGKNKELYGERYCPCVPLHKYFENDNKNYICPCKDFRENVAVGEECHCGLYVKEED